MSVHKRGVTLSRSVCGVVTIGRHEISTQFRKTYSEIMTSYLIPCMSPLIYVHLNCLKVGYDVKGYLYDKVHANF